MRTVVYMMVQYEECFTSISDLCPATLSPVFECGPDGLQFQVWLYLFIHFLYTFLYIQHLNLTKNDNILFEMHQPFSEMIRISFILFQL